MFGSALRDPNVYILLKYARLKCAQLSCSATASADKLSSSQQMAARQMGVTKQQFTASQDSLSVSLLSRFRSTPRFNDVVEQHIIVRRTISLDGIRPPLMDSSI
ncbi:unnamed protein product [Toxocara canis]|uniref:Uncharacterized protein n=1 Tax=Toxocara canis TaxID=6265 RepID=A0A183UTI2_TOXCA|nr:unnamed protein product [Toxocara canis]